MDTDAIQAALSNDPLDRRALDAWLQAALEAGDAASLDALFDHVEPALEQAPQPADLVSALERRARVAERSHPEMARHAYGRLARLWWKAVGQPERAEMLYRKIASSPGPYADECASFYTMFYAARGNWRRLEQYLLSLEPDAEDPATQARVRRKLARLAEEKGQLEKAASLWSAVASAFPDDDEATAALERLWEQLGKWHSLVDLYRKRAAALPADARDEKIALLKRCVVLYADKLHSQTKAIATWQAILELDPTNREALDALEQQYERMKRWPDLVRLLRRRADTAEDPQERKALLHRVGTLLLERFSNVAEAIGVYEQIVAIDPADEEATARLLELYERRRDFERYHALARARAQRIEDPGERLAQLEALARWAGQHIRNPRAAVETWNDVLALQPDHDEALAALERLYERSKQWEPLVEVLRRRIERADDEATRTALREKLATVLHNRLNRPEEAASVWRELLSEAPGHLRAVSQLRKFYLARRDWDGLAWLFRDSPADLARVLESQARSIDDPAVKLDLLRRIADLSLEQLDNPSRAIRALEQMLALDPDSREAAERLAPLCRDQKDFKRLVDVLDVLARTAPDEATRRAHLVELARVAETRLRDLERAFRTWREVFEADPRDVEARTEVDRLAAASGLWAEYVESLEQIARKGADRPVRAWAALRAAQIQRDELHDARAALRDFERAYALEPTSSMALDGLEGLYRQMGEWELLAKLLERKLELTSDEETDRALRYELGVVYRDRLGAIDEAAKVFEDILARYPTEAKACRELAAIHLEREAWEPLAEVLAKELELATADPATDPREVALLHVQMGQLLYALDRDLHDVVAHYREALELDPGCDKALAELEPLVASEEVRREVAEALAQAAAQRQDWPLWVDAFEVLVALEDNPAARIERLQRIASVAQEHLDDAHRAWSAYARIAASDPSVPGVLDALERLTASLGAWAPLVELYEARVEALEGTEGEGDEAQVALIDRMRRTLARVYEERLDDADAARRHWEAIRARRPTDAEALEALDRIYAAQGDWHALLDVCEAKLSVSESLDDKLALLARMAHIWVERVGDLERAIEAAERAVELAPQAYEGWKRLAGLHRRAQQWESLREDLEKLVELAPSQKQRLDRMAELAELFEQQLDRPADAVAMWELMLERDPQEPRAIEALERLFEERRELEGVARVLDAVYSRQERFRDLLPVLEARAETASEDAAAVEFRLRQARIAEEALDDPIEAFEYYGRALALAPHREDILDALARLADTLDAWTDFVALVAGHVDRIEDEARRAEVHRIVARAARDRLGDTAVAIRHFEAALELAPSDVATLDALIDAYRAEGRWEQLVSALERRAQETADPEEQAAFLEEAARVAADRIGDLRRAVSLFEEVRLRRPRDEAVLDALEDLYARLGAWDDVVAQLGERIEAAGDDRDKRRTLLVRRAHIEEERLDRPEAAIDTWKTVLEESTEPGQAREALEALDRLLARTEQWFDLINVLRRLQQLETTSAEDWAALQFRIARIQEEQLESPLDAVETCRVLLERVPGHAQAIATLERFVLTNEEARQRAFEVLVPVLEATEQWDRLFDLYEAMTDHTEDATAHVGLLHAMADVARDKLGNVNQAFACLRRALETDPSDDATVEALESLARRGGLWDDLQALYAQVARRLYDEGDVERALRLGLRAGAILREELEDSERALRHYEALRERHPDHPAVLEALDGLYAEREAWDALDGVLRDRADAAMGEERAALLLRRGDLALEHRDDPDTAFECFQELLALRPGDDTAVGRLHALAERGFHVVDVADLIEPVYLEREAWRPLRDLLSFRLAATQDRAEKVELLVRLGDLAATRLGDPAEGLRRYGEALLLDPDDDALLERMREVATQADLYDTWVDLVAQAAEAAAEPTRKAALRVTAARVALDALSDEGRAEALLLGALDAVDDWAEALQLLDAIYERTGQLEELERVLQRRVAIAEFDDERVSLLERLARLRQDRGDTKGAIEAWRAILDIDDAHPKALDALAQLYEREGQWQALSEVLGQIALVEPNEDRRREILARHARICAEQLGDLERAAELWQEVLALAPEDVEALRHFEDIAERIGQWDDLVDAIERELAHLADADAERRLALHRKAAHIAEEKLEETSRAQTHWEGVHALAPEDREALEHLRALYAASGAAAQLAEVLDLLVTREDASDDERARWWKELAELRTWTLAQPDRAVEAWEAYLELRPEDVEALEQVEQLYAQLERGSDLVGALNRHAAVLQRQGATDEACELWSRAAEVAASRLDDREAAIEAWRHVWDARPGDEDAAMRLVSLLEAEQRWGDLADFLLELIEHIEDPAERAHWLGRLAATYEERLGDAESALLVRMRALRETPDDPALHAEVLRLAAETKRWAEALGSLEEAADAIDDELLKADLLERLGAIARDELGDAERATALFERVLEIHPDAEEALGALSELYRLAGRWSDLARTLERLVDAAADYRKRTQAALQLADVRERRLDDVEGAIEALRQARDFDETNVDVLERMRSTFERLDRTEDLLDVLETLARVDAERELEHRAAIARTHERVAASLPDDDDEARSTHRRKAIEAWQVVLDRDPRSTEAMERLLDLCAQENDFEGLLRLFETRVELAEDPAQRREWLRKVARIREEVFEDLGGAIEAWSDIAAEHPDDEEAIGHLERLYARAERWEDLARFLETRAERAVEAGRRDEAAALFARAGAVARDRLEDTGEAIRLYGLAHEHRPDDEELASALEALYAQEGAWERVADLVRQRIGRAKGTARRRLIVRLAEILSGRLLRHEDAAARLEEALEEDPDNVELLQALQRVWAAAGRWDEVIAALRREKDAAPGDVERAVVLVRIAEIYRDELGETAAAIEALEEALALAPNLPEVLLPLAELYIRGEDWAKADALLQAVLDQLALEQDPARRAEVCRMLARTKENLGDDEAAIEAWRQAVEAQPDDADNVRGFARAAARAGDAEEALAQWTRWLELAGDEASADALAEAHAALGELCERLGRLEEAAEHFGAVATLRPGDVQALERLVAVRRAAQDWDGVVEAYAALLEHTEDRMKRLATLLDLGDVAAEHLGDYERAEEAYFRALDIDPHSRAALGKLSKLYMDQGRLGDLADVLRRLYEAESEPQARAQRAYALGMLYRDSLDDDEAAIEWLNRALDDNPRELEAFRELDAIYTRRKDWEGERDAYLRMIERLGPDGDKRVLRKLYEALGEIFRTRLDDYPNAVAAFTNALELAPDNIKILEILAELYDVYLDEPQRAIEMHRRLIALEPERRLGSYEALMRLYQEQGDVDAAWCVSALLVGLNIASDEVAAFYQAHRTRAPAQPERALDGALWREYVLAEGENVRIGQIFAIVFDALGRNLRSVELSELGLSRSDQLDRESVAANVFHEAAEILGVRAPSIFLHRGRQGVSVVNLHPPAIIVGENIASGLGKLEIAFAAGKALAYFLPIHIMAALYRPAELRAFWRAAIAVVRPEAVGGELSAHEAKVAALLDEHLRADARERLAHHVERALADGANVEAWVENVELSADHAGALVANDFVVALKALRRDPWVATRVPGKVKARDLALYATSARYLELRRVLGLAKPSAG